MLPVISISRLLLDEQTGIYHHDVTSIVEAIAKAKHKDTEILFLMDEPFWWVRRACEEKGKAEACLDVANRYVETLSTFELLGNYCANIYQVQGLYISKPGLNSYYKRKPILKKIWLC